MNYVICYLLTILLRLYYIVQADADADYTCQECSSLGDVNLMPYSVKVLIHMRGKTITFILTFFISALFKSLITLSLKDILSLTLLT